MANKNKSKHRSVNTPAASVPAAKVTTASKTMGRSFSTEFNPDYTFVKKDLTRIGTLAGIFFVVLVVLSFFLR
ncbi:MAG: hypothetical protein ABFD24_05910 [Anaerolineaceae bacterium]|jgi:hypothetical protein